MLMAELLRGAPVAAAITEELIRRAKVLKEKGVTPCLAILRVGQRPDDVAYERAAVRRCERVGIRVESIRLPEDCSQEAVLELAPGVDPERERGCGYECE